MSIASEIQRIKDNIEDAYEECDNKGATMPQVQNSDNLATTIASISGGGADLSEYFVTEITSNPNVNSTLTKTLIKKIPPITIGPNVTKLDNLFYEWRGETLIVPEMDLENITSLQSTFSYCYGSLLDISNLKNVKNVTTLYDTFRTNYADEIIGLDKWDVSKVTNMRETFNYLYRVKVLDLSNWETPSVTDIRYMFGNANYLSILDISKATFSRATNFSNAFSCGGQCKQEWGAYADGIPYVYVKDATEQNWILTANNGHPSTWSTANVVIKNNNQ